MAQPNAHSRVQLLDPATAARIAAGEVIERPSSVVKELVENSLDAGATEVAVILEDGGKALIEVIDNGSGIHPDDLALCVERHATSKLRTLADLEKVLTLGFRGEALPSIAAASELSLLSRHRDEASAYELVIGDFADRTQAHPKPATFGHFLSAPHGTRIQARGLFSQIPARLKFLKAAASEVANVREWLERIAIAHPKTGFKLVSNDRTVLNLRPHKTEAERVEAILSDSDGVPIISGESEMPGFAVRAHWIQGLSSPQTRKLVQVVNGRAVRDRMLQQAMLAAFRQALLPGQFPAVALFIDVDPAAIDVNVHPTKTEIRFIDSRQVFHAVDKLLSSMIEREGAPAYAAGPSLSSTRAPGLGAQEPQLGQNSYGASAPSFRFAPQPMSGPTTQQTLWSRPATMEESSAAATSEPTSEPFLGHPLAEARFAGTLFNTYLLHELGEELILVDQHAAHERIRYEKLRARALDPALRANATQALLIPEAVTIDPLDRARLEDRIGWLEAMGFEAEIFGEGSMLFRGIPVEWGTSELRTRLKNLVDRVVAAESESQGAGALLVDEALFEKLASEACHSAIRAGDRIGPEQAAAMVRDLFACAHPWNCPHGRPTVVRMPRARIEEWFLRRV